MATAKSYQYDQAGRLVQQTDGDGYTAAYHVVQWKSWHINRGCQHD